MGIRYLSEDIIFVALPKKPHLGNELNNINEIASDGCDYDVIIDFSRAKMLTSASISNLMLLKGFLSGLNHQLILCNVSTIIKYIFTQLGLETSFEFVGDKSAALAAVKQQQPNKSSQMRWTEKKNR